MKVYDVAVFIVIRVFASVSLGHRYSLLLF